MTGRSPLGSTGRLRIQRFYAQWTQPFLTRYGTTLQAGLLKETPDSPEDPTISARLLARRAGLREGDRVLDAGCGVGGPAVAMAEAIAGLRVDGVTLSAVQAGVAETLFTASPAAGRLSVTVADYHRLPFPDGCFDVVVLFETIGYSPDLASLAAELARVLRSGGRVYVKDVFRRDPMAPDDRRRVAAFDELWAMCSTPSLAEAGSAFARGGFADVHTEELGLVGDDRFLGAMFDLDPVDGLVLNSLGRHFLAGSAGLPLLFGEIVARRC